MVNSKIKRIGVFTSGGDAPGMNAAVRAVVRTAVYHGLHVFGINHGYQGMIEGEIERLEKKNVSNIIHRGGTFLRTARSKEFMTPEGRKKAYECLKDYQIDALVAVGGNGTYTGAKVFGEEYDMPIVGLPGTIDNDIYGTDYTIGFDTAVNTAVEAVDKIRDTADSHNRLFLIEVMGRHSGYIGLHAGLGSGATAIMIPEKETPIEQLIDKLNRSHRRKKLFSLVIVSEGNHSGNALEIAAEIKKRSDEIEPKVTIIGHLQRGGAPTCFDRVLSTRLGYAAVLALLGGEKDKAIGVVNDEISYTSFEEAITRAKVPNQELIDMAEIIAL